MFLLWRRASYTWSSKIAQGLFSSRANLIHHVLPEDHSIRQGWMGFRGDFLSNFEDNLGTGSSNDIARLVKLLKRCNDPAALGNGKCIHEHIVQSGLQKSRFLGNHLIEMYGKCSALEDAKKVFDTMDGKNSFSWNIMLAAYIRNGQVDAAYNLFRLMPQTDVISWTTMISAYAQKGELKKACLLFQEMPQRNVVSWNAMLSGYAQHGYLKEAFQLFQQMPDPDLQSWNIIISGYAQQGLAKEALQVFHQMPEQDVVSWNAMISAYAQNGQLLEMLDLFQRMPERDVVSWNAIISAHVHQGRLDEARQFFEQMPGRDIVSCNTMLSGYAHYGMVKEASELFHQMPIHDVVSWNSMVTAYAMQGELKEAVRIFRKMPQRDVASWNAIISAYVQQGRIEEAFLFFQEMPNRNSISWNAIIAAYAQCGRVDEAIECFQQMPRHTVSSWNSIIAGYVKRGKLKESLEMLKLMQLEGVKPNAVTFVEIVEACAVLAALSQAKWMHTCIISSGFDSNDILRTAIINMYAKCGGLEDVHALFQRLSTGDLMSWSTMITAYAQHGHGAGALQIIKQMQQEGVKPGIVTFISVLSACSHAGLLEDGFYSFVSMGEGYNITPLLEHFNCTIDLLGRKGYLDEAEALVGSVSCMPQPALWITLVSCCKIFGDSERGRRAAKQCLELDPCNRAIYTLLSNAHAAAYLQGSYEDMNENPALINEQIMEF